MKSRSLHATRNVDSSTFTKIRDYLICKTIIRNAQRSGALSNMMYGEWCKGKPSKEDPEGLCVMVSKTKTEHKHPVVLNFESDLKGAMSFFKHIRHQFARTNSGNLFFTSVHGNALSSSYIGTLIGAVANPTRVQKRTSTMVAFESDQVKKQTAALMTHTSATHCIRNFSIL